MSIEFKPPPSSPLDRAWTAFRTFGLASQVLVVAAAVGIVGSFFPSYTVTVMWVTRSTLVIDAPSGQWGLLSFAVILVSAILAQRPSTKDGHGAPTACAIFTVFAVVSSLSLLVEMLHLTWDTGPQLGPFGRVLPTQYDASLGIGLYLTTGASIACGVGAYLLAREKHMLPDSPPGGTPPAPPSSDKPG
jgi:hypothetical protein